jgi:UPF0755 protein
MQAKRFFSDLLLLLWLIIFSTISFYLYSIYLVPVKENQVFIIEKNSSLSKIGNELEKNKILTSQRVFFIFSLFYSKILNTAIKSGEYSTKGINNLLELLDLITSGRVVQHKITIPEGLTIVTIIKRLSQLDSLVQIPDKIGNIPEGSILPATYYYTRGTDLLTIINRMQNEMNIFINKAWPKRDKNIDPIIKTPEEAIILASIIEKESHLDSEKKIMAGVYLNRLQSKMRLQADPTLAYILRVEKPDWDGKVLYSHLKTISPYNTYRNSGLPPTAICNPGKKSILAVLQPSWTSQFFFFAGKDGKHIFSKTFEEHKAKRKIYQK